MTYTVKATWDDGNFSTSTHISIEDTTRMIADLLSGKETRCDNYYGKVKAINMQSKAKSVAFTIIPINGNKEKIELDALQTVTPKKLSIALS
jgi:ATP-dependent phosphoenolpyruvate carboxykinase